MKTQLKSFVSKFTAVAVCFGIAAGATVATPQKAEAFSGFFGFSQEACYDRVITQIGGSFGSSPESLIISWFLLNQTIQTVEYWTTSVCEESDLEKLSDATIKAAWAVCVNNRASSDDKSLLGLSRANTSDAYSSRRMWPYDKFSGLKVVRRNYAADRILLRVTNDFARYSGSTEHPTKVLNSTRLNNMLTACNATSAQKDNIARAASRFFIEDN